MTPKNHSKIQQQALTPHFSIELSCPERHFAGMTEKQEKKSPKEKLKSDAKQARLSEALRANLRRRKEQTRERKSPKE
mgnify:CR=1 FL=1